MTTIKFGSGHQNARAHHDIVSDGGTSEITFGDQYDNSRISTRIFDLSSPAGLPVIAQHLSDLAVHLEETSEGKRHPKDVSALKNAAKSAKEGKGDSVKSSLKGIGKWVLDTAVAIGKPVAVEFLKAHI